MICLHWMVDVLLFCSVILLAGSTDDCDKDFTSTDSHRKGNFTSPDWENGRYPDWLRCKYRFIGRPNERVAIRFTQFAVKGVPPRCLHDYVDMYTQVPDPDGDLLAMELHGRYCGADLELIPGLFVSMHASLILAFYTNEKDWDKGFFGTYEFTDGSVYMVGTPAPPQAGTTCTGQTIYSEHLRRGELRSPTYPGVYPDNIECFYRLQGTPGQRIKFTFVHLDLYSGGEHCPFDYVQIYDGFTNQDETIGVYCGKYNNIELFSTEESLHIEFVTKSGRVEPTRKPYLPYYEIDSDTSIHRSGFLAEFQFSSNFVNLNFITEGHHVVGTECDQRVLSSGESNGTIASPGYPRNYPLNITCTYYIDGLVDKQNLEKTSLQFTDFDIPFINSKCDNGYAEAYLNGQSIYHSPNYIFCGSELPQFQQSHRGSATDFLTTNDPRLMLVFNTTGRRAGRGFRANYHFVTDYAIPGTPATNNDCHFYYNSSSQKHGFFNSPRYPSYYPQSTLCTYEFFGLPKELVRITFNKNFRVENRFKNCSTDYIQAFAVEPARHGGTETQHLVGHFCGEVAPGLVRTERANILRVVFRSDEEIAMSGFRALYEFIERKPEDQQCFNMIKNGGGGKINSPHFPEKYKKNSSCTWELHSPIPEGKILIQMNMFYTEGKQELGDTTPEGGKLVTVKATSGCANAVLKLYANASRLPTHELCGQFNRMEKENLISSGNVMKIRFLTSGKSVGAKGFTFTWTELLPTSSGKCNGFLCEWSNFCIASSLQCNDQYNCGFYKSDGSPKQDESDEGGICRKSYTKHGALHITLGCVIALVLLIFLFICIIHKRRKARSKENKKVMEVRYVTRSGGGVAHDPFDNGPTPDQSLLKERTEKISNV